MINVAPAILAEVAFTVEFILGMDLSGLVDQTAAVVAGGIVEHFNEDEY